jgi:hypothetical protein
VDQDFKVLEGMKRMYDVTSIIGFGLLFAEDDKGRTIIDCARGYVYADEDRRGEHFVAGMENPTPFQRQRLFKLGLPTIRSNDEEYAVRCDYGSLNKVLKILKPKKRQAAVQHDD